MKVGYARVSTSDQELSLQSDALEGAGCEKIFHDHISGSQNERTGLTDAMEYLRPGDTLIVWRLDRLGRSLSHLIELVNQLAEQDIGFQSLQEAIDTTTSGGLLVFHIFGALAEFERNLIRERTQAGLEAARKRGRLGGRPGLWMLTKRNCFTGSMTRRIILSGKSVRCWKFRVRLSMIICASEKRNGTVIHDGYGICIRPLPHLLNFLQKTGTRTGAARN